MTYGYKFGKTYFKTLPHYHKLNTVERCTVSCLRTFIYAFYTMYYIMSSIFIYIFATNLTHKVVNCSIFNYCFKKFFFYNLLFIRKMLYNCIRLVNVTCDFVFKDFELDAIRVHGDLKKSSNLF